ncbi:hypothetical protein ABUE31_01195 [Mesorhizobium sp. ZMM04-5]|uniref:Uncharacterized protein n=1 Tax=Mesorhizobium marinum TaxID=3228790 RepID=A0ABV3QU40_9HYPH
MFFRSHRGRRDPHFLPIRDYEDPIRLDDTRLDAWATALGDPRTPRYRPRSRSHPGRLPDVDFARAVQRPGMFARLAGLVAERLRGDAGQAEAAVPASESTPLGESGRKPYVWVLDQEADLARPREPDGSQDTSRAA